MIHQDNKNITFNIVDNEGFLEENVSLDKIKGIFTDRYEKNVNKYISPIKKHKKEDEEYESIKINKISSSISKNNNILNPLNVEINKGNKDIDNSLELASLHDKNIQNLPYNGVKKGENKKNNKECCNTCCMIF